MSRPNSPAPSDRHDDMTSRETNPKIGLKDKAESKGSMQNKADDNDNGDATRKRRIAQEEEDGEEILMHNQEAQTVSDEEYTEKNDNLCEELMIEMQKLQSRLNKTEEFQLQNHANMITHRIEALNIEIEIREKMLEDYKVSIRQSMDHLGVNPATDFEVKIFEENPTLCDHFLEKVNLLNNQLKMEVIHIEAECQRLRNNLLLVFQVLNTPEQEIQIFLDNSQGSTRVLLRTLIEEFNWRMAELESVFFDNQDNQHDNENNIDMQSDDENNIDMQSDDENNIDMQSDDENHDAEMQLHHVDQNIPNFENVQFHAHQYYVANDFNDNNNDVDDDNDNEVADDTSTDSGFEEMDERAVNYRFQHRR